MTAAATTATAGKVTWFEVGSPDPARAGAFYNGVFGWEIQGDPGVYLAVQNREGISGGIIPLPAGVAPYAAFCVEVPDVDAAVARALACGASLVIPAEDKIGRAHV